MAADEPSLSVLMPVRDGASHLPACIASLAAQTHTSFEVVVVDDGSRDDTPALLARWAREDARVRVLTRPPEGIVAALEHARAAARAPLLARMDADDVALPRRFARQLEALAAHRAWGVCGAGVRYVPRARVRDGARRYEAWLNGLTSPEALTRDLFVECPLAHPTFLLRAEAVEAVGGYRDRGWPEDYDLVLRLWRRGWRLGTVPEVLLHWREGDARLSRRHAAYTPDAFRRCKVHHLTRSLVPGRAGVVLWGAGPVGKAFSHELRRVGVDVRAFVELDPRKIGQQIHGAPVIPPDEVSRFRDALVLAAVGQPGARAEIRAALDAGGWREGEEYVAVA